MQQSEHSRCHPLQEEVVALQDRLHVLRRMNSQLERAESHAQQRTASAQHQVYCPQLFVTGISAEDASLAVVAMLQHAEHELLLLLHLWLCFAVLAIMKLFPF